MGIYACFADLLEYPDDMLGPRLASCIAKSGAGNDAARDAILRFREEADRRGLPAVQELYTSAFDLDASCTLYVGHHLFGESARRGVFMARLAGEYRQSGFRCLEHELPDHLPVLLRYLDAITDLQQGESDEVGRELIAEILLPATKRIAEALEGRNHPYAHVLRALLVQLERADREAVV